MSRGCFLFFVVAVVFVQLCFLVLQSPICSMDEVGYNDPAVNLFLKGSFVSSTWGMNNNKFWAMNVPLYQFVIFLWMKIVGFSGMKIHVFHMILSLANAGLLFKLLKKCNVNMNDAIIYLLTFSFFTCGSYTYLILSARPDNLAITFVLIILLLTNLRPTVYTNVALFVVSFLLFSTSIPTAIILFSYILLFHYKLYNLLFVSCGFLFAGLSIFLIWYKFDVIDDFLSSSAYNKIESLKTPLKDVIFLFFAEISFLMFIAIFIIVNIRHKYQYFNLVKFLFLPVILYCTVKLNPYYVSVFVLILLLELVRNTFFVDLITLPSRIRKFLLFSFIIVNSYQLFGRCFVVWRDQENRDYSVLKFSVSECVNDNDVVYCEHPAYYEVKRRCKKVYTIQTLGLLSKDQLNSINVLVINPLRSKSRLSNYIDFSQWTIISTQIIDFTAGSELTEDNNVLVYRRK